LGIGSPDFERSTQMIELRFNITYEALDGSRNIEIYGLHGSFSQGKISNIGYILQKNEDLGKVLNDIVNKLISTLY
jgi:hypothetical protein